LSGDACQIEVRKIGENKEAIRGRGKDQGKATFRSLEKARRPFPKQNEETRDLLPAVNRIWGGFVAGGRRKAS